MRARVGSTLHAAEHDEDFSRALARLMTAAHDFNRWEPGAQALDDLCDAAEGYVEHRRRLAVTNRKE